MIRKILVGVCFVGMIGISSSMFVGCDDSKTSAPVKEDAKATEEHNDKMKEFMQSKKATKK